MAARRLWWQLAAPGLVLGTVAAVVRLDRDAFWLDEAYTLGSVHQLRSAVPRTSGTMSLYYALMRVWLVVSESVWWMRFLSVGVALAALALTVVLARRLLGDASAALAGVLVAASPMWWAYAREARAYALVLALVAVTWLAVDHGLDGDDARARRWWALHTAACVALPLGHGLTLLQLLPQLVVVAVARPGRATLLRAARGIGAAVLVTLLLARTASDEVGQFVDPLGWDVARMAVERFLGPRGVPTVLLALVVLAGAVVSVTAAARADSARERARLLLPILWGLVPLVLLALLSVPRPSFIARYAVGCVPGIALLMVVAVDRLGERRPSARAVTGGAVAVLLLAGIVDLQTRPVDGWRLAAARVAADVRPGDTVLLSREATTRPPFEAAWRDVAPAAPAVLLPSDRPLGEVLRFEPDETDNTVRWNEARSVTGRLWVVGDVRRLELDRLPSLTDGSPAPFREVGRWSDDVGGITVVLLEPAD